MSDENLQKLFDLSYSQLYSMWTDIRQSMIWAHEEIVRLRAKITELENKNANS
jgi:hypothetical protein